MTSTGAARASTKSSKAAATKALANEAFEEQARDLRKSGLSDFDLTAELRDAGYSNRQITDWLSRHPREKADDDKPADDKKPETEHESEESPSPRFLGGRFDHGSAGGLLLALMVYPAVIAYLNYGPSGFKLWYKAKFLNQAGPNPNVGSGIDALLNFGSNPAAGTAGSGLTPSQLGTPQPFNPAPGAGGLASVSPIVSAAIAFAQSQIGKPYQWGGTGNPGWDCSGLVQASYAAAGVSLPRTTQLQILKGKAVSKKNLQPGDLVFPDLGHVQLYTGGGQIIEAPRRGIPVRYSTLGTVWAARRVV